MVTEEWIVLNKPQLREESKARCSSLQHLHQLWHQQTLEGLELQGADSGHSQLRREQYAWYSERYLEEIAHSPQEALHQALMKCASKGDIQGATLLLDKVRNHLPLVPQGWNGQPWTLMQPDPVWSHRSFLYLLYLPDGLREFLLLP